MNRIDVHFHLIPQFYREASANAGRRPAISSGLPAWTPELAFELIEQHGIRTAITSITQPGVHFGDDEDARLLARACNEYAAELGIRYPGRFGAFAVLPLPDIGGALEEIHYALDVLMLDGVVLFANCEGVFLGDTFYDPIFEALDERGAVAFVHPARHPATDKIAVDLPAFAVEYVVDTTRAAANMIFAGTLDRFPKIRFILSHAGGTLPFIAWRLSMSPIIDPNRLGRVTPEHVLSSVGRFWYDTALSVSAHQLAALAALAPADHILFGSDWPFAPEAVTARSVEGLENPAILDPSRRAAVERENALKLFPRFA